MNKNRDVFSCLFKVGFKSKERVAMLSCLFGFMFSGNANCVTQSYIMRDGLAIYSSLSIVLKRPWL